MIILTGVTTYLFYYKPSSNGPQEEYIIHYEIEITPSDTYNYTVYFPIPVQTDSNGTESKKDKLLDEISSIDGVPDRRIVNTTFGWALKIEHNDNTILKFEKKLINPSKEKIKEYTIYDLSMWTDGKDSRVYDVNHSYNIEKDIIEYHRLYYNSTQPNSTTEISCDVYTKRTHEGGYSEYIWGFEEYNMREGWQTLDFAVVSVVGDKV